MMATQAVNSIAVMVFSNVLEAPKGLFQRVFLSDDLRVVHVRHGVLGIPDEPLHRIEAGIDGSNRIAAELTEELLAGSKLTLAGRNVGEGRGEGKHESLRGVGHWRDCRVALSMNTICHQSTTVSTPICDKNIGIYRPSVKIC